MNEKETLARTFIYRMRLEKVAAALSVVTLACGALPAAASLVTVQQTLEGSYSYIPICTSFDEYGACTSYPNDRDPTIDKTINKLTSSALQQTTKLEPNDVLGADEVVAQWTIDVDNGGQIKTYSNLRVEADNRDLVNNGNVEYLTEISVTATNQISFTDLVSTTDPLGTLFRFETVITGTLGTTTDYQAPGEEPIILGGRSGEKGATYDHEVKLSSSIAETITYPWQFFDLNGPQTGGFVTKEAPVDFTARFFDMVFEDSPLTFSFNFEDRLVAELKNPDGAYWAFGMANDLGNTITTYASVFDAAGNLLPDARVVSETGGFSYAPLRQYANPGNGGGNGVPTQVSAPGTALLMALGLLGMGRTRYRSVVSLGRPKSVRAIASISTNIRALLIAYVCLAARGSRTAA